MRTGPRAEAGLDLALTEALDHGGHRFGFDAACLRGKADADPALGYELLQRFAQITVARLQAARWRLLDLYGSTVPR